MPIKVKKEAVLEILAKKFKSQEWLAENITGKGYVSQLLNGRRNPSPNMCKKLLQKLEVKGFDDIFEWVSELKAS